MDIAKRDGYDKPPFKVNVWDFLGLGGSEILMKFEEGV